MKEILPVKPDNENENDYVGITNKYLIDVSSPKKPKRGIFGQ